MYSRLEKLDYHVELSEEATEFIAEKGWDKDFGARPLKRAIQKYIEDLLAEMLVNKQMKEGDKIVLKLNEAKDALEAEKSPKRKKKSLKLHKTRSSENSEDFYFNIYSFLKGDLYTPDYYLASVLYFVRQAFLCCSSSRRTSAVWLSELLVL